MKEKIKLYVYPNAKEHAHDKEKIYRNTVPLSEDGIQAHCSLVSPEEADYFYMGQISDGMAIPSKNDFFYINGNEQKHICDIEGDWFNRELPKWLESCTLTMNGVRDEYVEKNIKIFARPTFSYLLMDIVKNNRKVKYTFNGNKKFGFKGYPDPLGIRNKMLEACNLETDSISHNIIFNDRWQARAQPGSKVAVDYCKQILGNTFSLCPRGTGVDTIRFFETCFFSRIPVVISNCQVFGHDYHLKNPFYFKIKSDISSEEILHELKKIKNTPIEELKIMSFNAKQYFENYVREYFRDPTLSLIKWLKL